jgi:hypothetical protein
MQNTKESISRWLPVLAGCVLLLMTETPGLFAQTAGDLKYLRCGSLHSFFGARGTEPEYPRHSASSGLRECDGLWWPAEYGDALSNMRAKAFWIGTKNFIDPVLQTKFAYKVVGIGPRDNPAEAAMAFPVEHKLIGKFNHPLVLVDGLPATENDYEDVLDEVDDDLVADRMIVTRVNTSIGITVTRKIMAFSQQQNDNYFVYEYIFKNTGIIDNKGTTVENALDDVVFHFQHRYAPGGGEPVPGYNEGWGIWESTWGRSCMNQVINTGPEAPTMQYSWYGPHSDRNVPDDWGCPNEQEDGILGAVQYIGFVTLHADKSAQDPSNDPNQPTTTHFLGSDETVLNNTYNQYDAAVMQAKYEAMTMGHAEVSQADQIVQQGIFANQYGDDDGGYSQAVGYGPYDMEPGDSIRIVLAEGIAGISRQKNREVGRNWLIWLNGEGAPTLVKPDGSQTTDYNAYKREWVQTGEDSILQTLNRAVHAFNSDFSFPQPPPPPESFTVNSGGDRIQLSWADNATSWPKFDGYVIYRSKGSVTQPETIYEKLFECDKSNLTHTFDDTSAQRGFNYYYYVQSKDDGTTSAGTILYSGKFWTMTSVAATLQRPAIEDSLEAIRIVPNPYDIRSRALQYGVDESFDRIAFLNLPLIWSTMHDNYTGDELWDSKTSSGQIVVSGLYLVHFETPDGKAIIRKMIIIR